MNTDYKYNIGDNIQFVTFWDFMSFKNRIERYYVSVLHQTIRDSYCSRIFTILDRKCATNGVKLYKLKRSKHSWMPECFLYQYNYLVESDFEI